jgi:hypothetical protein
MPADTTGKAVQVLDLMLDFFAEDDHWSLPHSLGTTPVSSFAKRAAIGLLGANSSLGLAYEPSGLGRHGSGRCARSARY